MSRRWLKKDKTDNTSTATRVATQAQSLYWYLTNVCQFVLVDSSGTWSNLGAASNGTINVGNTITIPVATGGHTFSNTDVNKKLALRDNTTPSNSGIYKITAVSGSLITLDPTIANFTAIGTNVQWTLFDPATPPATASWFIVKGQNNSPWQARLIVDTTLGNHFELGSFGGWNVTTNSWGLPVTSQVTLYPTTLDYTYAVADEALGAFFIWSKTTGNGVSGVYCGNISSLHQPVGNGVPKDTSISVLLGDNTGADNTLNRTSGFAVHGFQPKPDHTGYDSCVLHKWFRIGATDIFADSTYATNPRSVEVDSYTFLVGSPSGSKSTSGDIVKGILPLVRMTNDSVAQNTLINSSAVYVINNGIAVEWDFGPSV